MSGNVVYMQGVPIVTAGSSTVAQDVSSAINDAMSGQKQTQSDKDKKADSKAKSKDKKADNKVSANDKKVDSKPASGDKTASANDQQGSATVNANSNGSDSGNVAASPSVKTSNQKVDNKPASASFKKWGNIGD